MKYKEETGDLFLVPSDYCLVQTISADLAMGTGIAYEFNKRYQLKRALFKKYGERTYKWDESDKPGECLKMGNVFSLVIKRGYTQKATYPDIRTALHQLKVQTQQYSIKKIAMPKFGCDKDGLKWQQISDMIKAEFMDTDMEILIRTL